MNGSNIYTIGRAIYDSAEVRFSYRTPSGSVISVEGIPSFIRRNKDGSCFVAITQPGYGYGTWTLDNIVGPISISYQNKDEGCLV